ncbi:DUF6233 domain-containing protein [Streptomyces sp. Tu6071]|uniref:DUF6233 domain-containing protein n=1 Tax=Streptomyces sp. Tu6071 TaxID=355249 RepID=UPI002D21BB2D|nr:DUF6233 domain-containing protein [Streptomyces sp. Tu6071]
MRICEGLGSCGGPSHRHDFRQLTQPLPPGRRHGASTWRASSSPSIGKRSRGITRDQTLGALAEGVEVCDHCRPDTALGWMG